MNAIIYVVFLLNSFVGLSAAWAPCPPIPQPQNSAVPEHDTVKRILQEERNIWTRRVPKATQNAFQFGSGAELPPVQECDFLNVPLDYNKNNTGIFPIMIMRFRHNAPSAKQVWLIPGGPGEVRTGNTHVTLQRPSATQSGQTLLKVYFFHHN